MQGSTPGRQLETEILEWLMAAFPHDASAQGLPTRADAVMEFDPGAFCARAARAREYLQRLKRGERWREQVADRWILAGRLRDIVRDDTARVYQRNPCLAAQVVAESIQPLLVRAEPGAGDLETVGRRLDALAGLVGGAAERLRPDPVPSVWAQTALDMVRGLEQMVRTDRGAPLAGRLVRRLVQALIAYAAHLEAIVPEARGSFAVGEAGFRELLRERHMLEQSPDELAAEGAAAVARTTAELTALAWAAFGGRPWQEALATLRATHPPGGGLLSAARAAVDWSRTISMRELAVAPTESLRVENTPAHLRSTFPYAAYSPPPAFALGAVGHFFVTADAPGSEQILLDEKLRITAVHEGYPGHHLQFAWAVHRPSPVRRLAASSLLCEGWARHCEGWFAQLGHLWDLAHRLTMLADELWRAARVVVDVGLHCRGLTPDAAVQLLVRDAGLEQAAARAEVRRYVLAPTQPLSYLVGRRLVRELFRDAARAGGSEFDRRAFTERFLRVGILPPAWMRRLLLGARP